MEQFVSETIQAGRGDFDTAAMGRGEPGLPAEFSWRGQSYAITAKLAQWKESAPEGGKPGGELYLRRHYYRLRMSDDSVWTVYFVRQTPKSGRPQNRWYLYTCASQPS